MEVKASIKNLVNLMNAYVTLIRTMKAYIENLAKITPMSLLMMDCSIQNHCTKVAKFLCLLKLTG